MPKGPEVFPPSLLDELHTSGAGYDILRYISLPELFGDEADTLLYFTGKNIARKFEIQSMQDIGLIFEKLGWGKLELIKETKRSITFHLLADAVAYRLLAPFQTEFRLEAGFLAEAVQHVIGVECECTEEIHTKIHQVEFQVVFTK
ncbi:YslB family protein [Ornithinibacillus sp. 4-3]|uniref:YslB family protein n=1 Tax=Ornithinibacillus sp. 4-3 TaxID=3231488 RepID=A0AB39HHJ4_9BACI